MIIDDDLVTSVLGLQGRIAEDYVPAGLANMNVDLLVGMSVGHARAQVEGVGGELHVLASWNAPFDVRPWRVIVEIAGGQVVRVLGRG